MSSPPPPEFPQPNPPFILDHRNPQTPSLRPPKFLLAISAFVCSLVFRIPFIASRTGVVRSLFALRSNKKIHFSRRDFAITGLWVDFAGFLLWTTIAV